MQQSRRGADFAREFDDTPPKPTPQAWPRSIPRLGLPGSTPGPGWFHACLAFLPFDSKLPSEIRSAPALLLVGRLPRASASRAKSGFKPPKLPPEKPTKTTPAETAETTQGKPSQATQASKRACEQRPLHATPLPSQQASTHASKQAKQRKASTQSKAEQSKATQRNAKHSKQTSGQAPIHVHTTEDTPTQTAQHQPRSPLAYLPTKALRFEVGPVGVRDLHVSSRLGDCSAIARSLLDRVPSSCCTFRARPAEHKFLLIS